MWKIGITSLIQITQSKVRPIENLAFLMISTIFEMLLLWTAWPELSLWYQFSTQNLMPNNFWLRVLAKFRHRAILAIFGGYFWLFSPKRLVFKFNDIPFRTVQVVDKKMAYAVFLAHRLYWYNFHKEEWLGQVHHCKSALNAFFLKLQKKY